jgi:hypothetical protein
MEDEEESKPAKELRTLGVPAAEEKEEVIDDATPSHRPGSLFELMVDGDWLYVPVEKRLEYHRLDHHIQNSFMCTHAKSTHVLKHL